VLPRWSFTRTDTLSTSVTQVEFPGPTDIIKWEGGAMVLPLVVHQKQTRTLNTHRRSSRVTYRLPSCTLETDTHQLVH
jgi:hypothetical protein